MNKIIVILLLFVSTMVLGQGATPNLRGGIVGYWKFEESSGTIAIDQKGNNNGATNATINQTGKVGKCYDYNGSNDYTSLAGSSTLFPDGDNWSISLWFNTDDIPSTNIDRRILTITEGSDASLVILAVGSTDNFQLSVDFGGSGVTYNTHVISTNTWYHVVVAFNGTTYKTYLDNGSAVNTVDGFGTPDATTVKVGTRAGATNDFFNGTVDELLIYGRVLSTLEVKQLYNSDSGLLFVQENFKTNYNYEALINYFIQRDYFTWITGAKY